MGRAGRNEGRLDLRPTTASAAAGAGAGALTTTVCSPLDVVKMRMQLQHAIVPEAQRSGDGLACWLRTIYREEGVRGWFRGYSSAMLTVPLFWGVYFPCYAGAKRLLLPHCDHKPLVHMSAAVCGGLITDVVTNPFWVARTRLVSQHMHMKYEGAERLYYSTFQTMRIIVQQEGVRGLYKGLTASFLGLSHVAVQFPLYEALKEAMAEPPEPDGSAAVGGWGVLCASTLSKLIASTMTYPHEVVRARLQDQRDPSTGGRGLLDAFVQITRSEGARGLYRGLGVNLTRVIPSTAVTFVSYEWLNHKLQAL